MIEPGDELPDSPFTGCTDDFDDLSDHLVPRHERPDHRVQAEDDRRSSRAPPLVGNEHVSIGGDRRRRDIVPAQITRLTEHQRPHVGRLHAR